MKTNASGTADSVFAPGAKLEKLAGGFDFTEGPTCDAAGNVFFTDQPNDRILKWGVEGELSTFLQPAGRANGMCFAPRGHLIACADEKNGLCRKIAFSRQNPKIVYWKINNLRVQTFLFSVICDRALSTAQALACGKKVKSARRGSVSLDKRLPHKCCASLTTNLRPARPTTVEDPPQRDSSHPCRRARTSDRRRFAIARLSSEDTSSCDTTCPGLHRLGARVFC